ncbi:hypothetical protein GCM10017044_08530 [Kordiimonas sediminis]|uniref:Fe2OG dioxygenase domain-containing protein n=1 Tax=Kordiimonas sediminis TaxID=1735581 RepID=A0A919AMM7_9PROT|nr:2OG-Fe(II) oxygenase [Kordiimonas sediminis]GHF16526.1 hypothetical protein GCM10017044_08530 [Kordiimonas sediminis]
MEQQAVDMQALATAAKAGDPDAQYKMAAILSGEGHREQSVALLKKAAANGHADARYTLATSTLLGLNVPRNPEHAANILAPTAAKGHLASARLYAVLQAMGHGCEKNWPAAINNVMTTVQEGHAGACRDLALLLILYRTQDDLSLQLLMAAASRKDIISAMILVERFLHGETLLTPGLAKAWCAHAKQMGHPLAFQFEPQISAEPDFSEVAVTDIPDITTDDIKALLAEPDSLPVPDATYVLDRPRVKTIKGLFPREICNYLIAQSAPRLAPARIIDPQTGALREDPYRKSYTVTLWPVDMDIVLFAAGAIMCAAGDAPSDHGEMTSILAYEPGMQYGAHYDCLIPDAEGKNPELERSGQRPRTVLVYLNQEYDGGETRFVRSEYQYKGETGDAIVFDNVLDDGTIDEQSLHEGCPVTGGVKWLASKWIREKTYQF